VKLTLLLKLIPFEAERALCSKLNALLGRRPSSAPFLSGDTYRALADYLYDETESLDPSSVTANSLIFVNSYRLKEFINRALPAIHEPFVLITHQGDLNIGEEFRVLAEHPLVLHWFSQNCLLKHPKVTPLPIGLEDKWRHDNGVVSHFKRLANRNVPRIPRIAYGFSIGTNLEKRLACYRALQTSKAAAELPRVLGGRLYRKIVSEYMFIASPPGNGLDCHRTWEALYMGCVPIVEDNYMNRSFQAMGLPMALVRNWDEVRDWSEEELKARYAELRGGARPEALFAPWWAGAFSGARKTE
jgi:hypothetical protein